MLVTSCIRHREDGSSAKQGEGKEFVETAGSNGVMRSPLGASGAANSGRMAPTLLDVSAGYILVALGIQYGSVDEKL